MMSETLSKALLIFTLSSMFFAAGTDSASAVRLVGGPGPCSGRVEVLHLGQWGTVCDDTWDLENAQVACRELGCGRAVAALNWAHFGKGDGAIWILEAQCWKSNKSLADCIYTPPPPRHINCKHEEDAGVDCVQGSTEGGSVVPRWLVALLVMLVLVMAVLGTSCLFYRRYKIHQLQSGRRECEANVYIDMTVQ